MLFARSTSAGAATSPALSNLVAVRMDQRLTRLSTHAGLTYTRYADDLIFSGEYIGSIFRRDISRIVEDCGFAVNKSKTALFTKPGRRIVTGVCVEGDDPRVPRGFRRGLRQELHYVMKHGLLSHISKHKIRDPFYLDSLYGRVNFWLFVEPTNEFANEAKRRLRALLANRNQS